MSIVKLFSSGEYIYFAATKYRQFLIYYLDVPGGATNFATILSLGLTDGMSNIPSAVSISPDRRFISFSSYYTSPAGFYRYIYMDINAPNEII